MLSDKNFRDAALIVRKKYQAAIDAELVVGEDEEGKLYDMRSAISAEDAFVSFFTTYMRAAGKVFNETDFRQMCKLP